MYGRLNQWWCSGCGTYHRMNRDIEGDDNGRFWCRHSIYQGIKKRRNDLPPQAFDHHGNMKPHSFAP
jgi:hypothetical protein